VPDNAGCYFDVGQFWVEGRSESCPGPAYDRQVLRNGLAAPVGRGTQIAYQEARRHSEGARWGKRQTAGGSKRV